MEQGTLIEYDGKPRVERTASSPYTARFKLQTFTVQETEPRKWQTAIACRSSENVFRLAQAIYSELDADKETFVLLAVNNKNRLLGFKVISTGTLTSSLVHPREAYTAALYFHAAGVVFVHNHPSSDPAPSPEDIDITRRLKEVGDVMGIRVLDHVVVGKDRYFSFADKGML
jgi:DNA repair protein RadC